MEVESLPWTGDADADRLLAANSFALLMGMLLDQQFPMERAFYGPYLLQQRVGVPPTATLIAEMDPGALEPIFKGPPAIHRFPGAFATRTHELATFIVQNYDGDTARIWITAETGEELYRRLRALPGFGDAKARIFVGVLGKRLEVRPPGWEGVAADWASIADVAKWEDVFTLRQQKREIKAAKNGLKVSTSGIRRPITAESEEGD